MSCRRGNCNRTNNANKSDCSNPMTFDEYYDGLYKGCSPSKCFIDDAPPEPVVRSDVFILPFYDEIGTEYPNSDRDGQVVYDLDDSGFITAQKVVPYPGRNYERWELFRFIRNITPAAHKRFGVDKQVYLGRQVHQGRFHLTLEVWGDNYDNREDTIEELIHSTVENELGESDELDGLNLNDSDNSGYDTDGNNYNNNGGEGEQIVPFNYRDIQYFDSIVASLSEIPKRHCLLYHPDYQGCSKYPLPWLSSVLPFISLDGEYEAITLHGALYIKLPTTVYYENVWYESFDSVCKQLDRWNRMGVVLADSRRHREVIASWDLAPYVEPTKIVRDDVIVANLIQTLTFNNEVGSIIRDNNGDICNFDGKQTVAGVDIKGTVEEPELTLYYPQWNDSRITRNITQFISDRLNGKTFINFDVGYNEVVRHWLSVSLLQRTGITQSSFYFIRCQLYVKCTSLSDAQSVLSLVINSKRNAGGRIELEDLYTELSASGAIIHPIVENLNKFSIIDVNTDVVYYQIVDDTSHLVKSTWYNS